MSNVKNIYRRRRRTMSRVHIEGAGDEILDRVVCSSRDRFSFQMCLEKVWTEAYVN